jgi:hypothetical protein
LKFTLVCRRDIDSLFLDTTQQLVHRYVITIEVDFPSLFFEFTSLQLSFHLDNHPTWVASWTQDRPLRIVARASGSHLPMSVVVDAGFGALSSANPRTHSCAVEGSTLLNVTIHGDSPTFTYRMSRSRACH